ncbi:MAG: hypothetical protein IKR18_09365 [Bacteroidaceae bacterium]|nr:hypothetical protein [Bacteroidaceae bacterium]
MKRLFVFLLLLHGMFVFCQTSQKYIILTFNEKFQIRKYVHVTGDYLWIVPFDSCKNGLNVNAMRPLFANKDQLCILNDSTANNTAIGQFPIGEWEYNKSDMNLWKLYKNRRLVQKEETDYNYPKARKTFSVYITPIVGKCATRLFSYYKKEVITLDEKIDLWPEFWTTSDDKLLRSITHYNFKDFKFIVDVSPIELKK